MSLCFLTQLKESYFFQVLLKVDFRFTSTFKRKIQNAVFSVLVLPWCSADPGRVCGDAATSSASITFRPVWRARCGYESPKPANRTKLTMVAYLPPCPMLLSRLTRQGETMGPCGRGRTGQLYRSSSESRRIQGPTSIYRIPISRDENKTM